MRASLQVQYLQSLYKHFVRTVPSGFQSFWGAPPAWACYVPRQTNRKTEFMSAGSVYTIKNERAKNGRAGQMGQNGCSGYSHRNCCKSLYAGWNTSVLHFPHSSCVCAEGQNGTKKAVKRLTRWFAFVMSECVVYIASCNENREWSIARKVSESDVHDVPLSCEIHQALACTSMLTPEK